MALFHYIMFKGIKNGLKAEHHIPKKDIEIDKKHHKIKVKMEEKQNPKKKRTGN